MAAINDLIRQITDPDLRERIQKEVDKLAKQKKFGLVYEEHLPECTPLYDIPVRRGAKVALKAGEVSDFYQVLKIENDNAICIKRGEEESVAFPIADLVTIAEFGEPIYPYLKPIDAVCNASDSDLWHTLIEADNFHALQLLEYLYAGKVDCIYIDPPYNTGARDWKYNNDYVDGNDTYRHSKWLSMMQKRLKIAGNLLNPKDSVLIITIDEKEYLHLGCLLEEMFPNANMQMISTMTNKKGSTRPGQFSRAGEYIFLLFFGGCVITPTRDNMLLPQKDESGEESEDKGITIWNSLLRRGTAALRADRPNLFYPIYVDRETQRIVRIGNPLLPHEKREEVPFPADLAPSVVPCWPIRKDDVEGRWQMSHTTLKKRLAEHRVKAGQFNKTTQQFSIVMLKDKQIEQIENNILRIVGIDDNGAYIVEQSSESESTTQRPRTIWVRDSHDASVYGSTLIKGILKDHNFSFPKSLYAVEDVLRFFVADKKTALIVDFFAGSGTTLHAVNRLNAEDGGNRRCIMVTNNEVSDEEATQLRKQGFRPGDEEWERLGIARYVTWPRTVCSIEGHDVHGNTLKGNYLGNDQPLSDGFRSNAVFFKLGFLDKTAVCLGMQFKELLPVLWMKAGAIGKMPEIEADVPDMLILPENKFAVLINENAFASFEAKMQKHPAIQTVFIVTDYEVNYRAMVKSLSVRTSYQLYRDYLDNFRINHGRN